MKAYKCDICGVLFADRLHPTLPDDLMIVRTGLSSVDICAGCLETLRNTVSDLSRVTEENDEFKTSSGEC